MAKRLILSAPSIQTPPLEVINSQDFKNPKTPKIFNNAQTLIIGPMIVIKRLLIFTVFGAYILFGETFSLTQWLGVLLLLAGIFGLALYNLIYLEKSRETLPVALIFAVCTGSFVAIYTTIDAYGIRLAIDPLAFIVWFFLFDSLSITPYAIYRWLNLIERPNLFPLAIRGVAGGIVAFFSFGSIMLATRLDKVGEAAVLRETSTVFAAIIGWVFLKETVGPRRVLLMALIAFGAVVVELGG